MMPRGDSVEFSGQGPIIGCGVALHIGCAMLGDANPYGTQGTSEGNANIVHMHGTENACSRMRMG